MFRILSNAFFFFACIGLIIVFCANLGVFISAEPYMYGSLYETPNAEAALVLGGSLSQRELTPLFAERLDMAIHFYEEKKVSRIIVSGIGYENVESELTSAHKYLLKKGIPDTAISLDSNGYDTYTTLSHLERTFDVGSVLLATQEFYLPRAIFVSRMLGLEAHGLKTDDIELHAGDRIDEALATPTALYYLFFKREGKEGA